MGSVTCVRAQVAFDLQSTMRRPILPVSPVSADETKHKPSGDLKATPPRASEKLPAVFLLRVEVFSRLDSGVH